MTEACATISNPFPGLRPFEPDEDHLFFGRERETDELLRRLRRSRFLAVVGASGSGKSSLVRSGVIPALHSGLMAKAGSRWRVALMRPGENPLRHLAVALHGALPASTQLAHTSVTILEATLRRSSQGVVDAVRHAGLPGHENVLVVVDQFEELFRFARARGTDAARDDAQAFVRLLLGAASQRGLPVYVLLTMRSDFIGDCMEFAGLPEAVNEGQYLVPRMSRDAHRTAITGPVAVAGAEIEARLVVRLLNELGDNPAQLPVLQHALMRTWAYWEADHAPGERIDVRHYEAVGTMAGALSRHADEPYGALPTDRDRKIAEVLFRSLADVDEEGRGVRRPVRIRDAAAVARATEAKVADVVRHFRAPGATFLTASSDPPEGDTIVDLSHEVLIRAWDRLAAWIRDESRSAAQYRRLAAAARDHAQGTGSLWRNPELELALRWRAAHRPTAAWAERYDPAFPLAMSFLDRSQRARRRRRGANFALIAGALLGFLLVLAFGVRATRAEIRAASEESKRKAGEIAMRDLRIGNLKAQIERLKNERPELVTYAADLQARNLRLRRERNALLVENDSLRQVAPPLVREVVELRREAAGLEASILRQEQERQTLEERRAALANTAGPLRDENDRLRTEQESLSRRGEELMRAAQVLGLLRLHYVASAHGVRNIPRSGPPTASPGPSEDPEIRRLRVKLDSLNLQGLRLREKITLLLTDNAELQKEIGSLQLERDRLRGRVATLRSERDRLTERVTELREVQQELRTAVAALSDTVYALDERVRQLRVSNAALAVRLPELREANRGLEALLGLDSSGTMPDRIVNQLVQVEDDPELSAVLALTADQLHQRQDGRHDPVILGGLWLALQRLDGPVTGTLWSGPRVQALTLAPDGRTLVAVTRGGVLRRFDLNSSGGSVRLAARDTLAGLGDVSGLAFSGDGRLLAVISQGGLSLLDAGSLRPAAIQLPKEVRQVPALAFGPGRTAVFPGGSGIAVWTVGSASTGQAEPCVERDVRSVAFSADGRLFACGTSDGEVEVWNWQPARRLAVLRAPCDGVAPCTNDVVGLSFDRRGEWLGANDDEGLVRVWNWRTHPQPALLPTYSPAAAFAPDQGRVIAATFGELIQTVIVGREPLVAEICRRLSAPARSGVC